MECKKCNGTGEVEKRMPGNALEDTARLVPCPACRDRTDTELAELERDEARLDWVIAQGGNVITHPHTYKRLGVELWEERSLVYARIGETLRQAIDAAMDAEKRGKGDGH